LLERTSRGVESREGSRGELRSSEFVMPESCPEGGKIDPHGIFSNLTKSWSELSKETPPPPSPPPPPPFPSPLLPPPHQELWHQQQHFQAPLMAHPGYYRQMDCKGWRERGECGALPQEEVDHTAAREEVNEEERKQQKRAKKSKKTGRKKQTKIVCTFDLDVADRRGFPFCGRFIGPKGANMKRIVNLCPTAKIRLRGKGSGHVVANRHSNDIPLQIDLSCLGEDEFEVAKEEISKLLSEIYKEYEEYKRERELTAQLYEN